MTDIKKDMKNGTKEIIDILNEIMNDNNKILQMIKECREDFKVIK